MTVAELIEALKDVPGDQSVWIEAGQDYPVGQVLVEPKWSAIGRVVIKMDGEPRDYI